MNVICAWCRALMGQKPPLANSGPTHGICGSCYDTLAAADRATAADPLTDTVPDMPALAATPAGVRG